MNSPIRQIREKRRDLLLILATAVLLALSINCVTSYLTVITEDQPRTLLLLSGAFFLGGIFILKHIAFGPTEHLVRLKGAIMFDEDGTTIKPVKILGYSFNENFCIYLNALFQENEAYAKLFSKMDSIGLAARDTFNPDDLNFHSIINSVLEFMVLHQLQLHLNSYFVDNEIDKHRIVKLERNQLGSDVLRNRVIDLISKDMRERAAFADHSDSEPERRVFYSPKNDGHIYQRIEIELPPRSNISRNSAGFLVISNPLFDLKIMPNYRGFGTYFAPILIPSLRDLIISSGEFRAPLLAEIKLHIRIKRRAFVTGNSLEIYEWLDSFVERMNDYVSTDRLEQRINPDLIEILKS